ncbi:hypothetical protein LB516_26755 [Mesorhizobium sp. CO1-1-7]|uniref:hypothetical protein n=2 Tax=Mesorhizobium TaxID=68287 RepID=UPI001CD0C4D2|nr:hypothetical protein [Mesorhizobium sp. CO1-1-7]MBZ9748838.1 hypothetical protein [Mesorhizobium sp. CO1-1-7]
MVSATCLARLTVPSVSEIVRLAASSLLMVSRADWTAIGFPAAPMGYVAIDLTIGLIAMLFPFEVLIESMALSLLEKIKTWAPRKNSAHPEEIFEDIRRHSRFIPKFISVYFSNRSKEFRYYS